MNSLGTCLDVSNIVIMFVVFLKIIGDVVVVVYFFLILGHGWEASIKQMALSVVKLEVLSVSPNSEVRQ